MRMCCGVSFFHSSTGMVYVIPMALAPVVRMVTLLTGLVSMKGKERTREGILHLKNGEIHKHVKPK